MDNSTNNNNNSIYSAKKYNDDLIKYFNDITKAFDEKVNQDEEVDQDENIENSGDNNNNIKLNPDADPNCEYCHGTGTVNNELDLPVICDCVYHNMKKMAAIKENNERRRKISLDERMQKIEVIDNLKIIPDSFKDVVYDAEHRNKNIEIIMNTYRPELEIINESLEHYNKTLEQIDFDIRTSGKIKSSLVVYSPDGFGKKTWAYECLLSAFISGMKVVPYITANDLIIKKAKYFRHLNTGDELDTKEHHYWKYLKSDLCFIGIEDNTKNIVNELEAVEEFMTQRALEDKKTVILMNRSRNWLEHNTDKYAVQKFFDKFTGDGRAKYIRIEFKLSSSELIKLGKLKKTDTEDDYNLKKNINYADFYDNITKVNDILRNKIEYLNNENIKLKMEYDKLLNLVYLKNKREQATKPEETVKKNEETAEKTEETAEKNKNRYQRFNRDPNRVKEFYLDVKTHRGVINKETIEKYKDLGNNRATLKKVYDKQVKIIEENRKNKKEKLNVLGNLEDDINKHYYE